MTRFDEHPPMLTFETRDGTSIATMQTPHIEQAPGDAAWRLFTGPLTASEAFEAIQASNIGNLAVAVGEKKYKAWIEDPTQVNMVGGPVRVRGRFAVPEELAL